MSEDQRRGDYAKLMDAEARVNRAEIELDHKRNEHPLDQQQRTDLLSAQKRASEVYNALSLGTPSPLPNEHPIHYKVRVASALKDHSPEWRYTDLYRLARGSPSAFANAESQIYAQASERGLDPGYRGHVQQGQLRERIEIQPDGTRISAFHGDIADCLAPLTGRHQLAVKSFAPRFPQFRRVK
jgi:hypothetical protein